MRSDLWCGVVCALLALTAPAFAVSPDGRMVKPPSGPGEVHLHNAGRPKIKVPFPSIRDWNSLEITLARGPCFGTCPVYNLTLKSEGTVIYEGREFVAVTGRHVAHVSSQKMRALFAAFQAADFFWLYNSYFATVTDGPQYEIAIAYDGRRMDVLDYIGGAIGMPKEVSDLESRIDRLAGVERWIKGNAETLPGLKREGWRFAAGYELLESAAHAGNVELLAQLIASGTPLTGKGRPSACAALKAASDHGDLHMMQLLLDHGAPFLAPATNKYGDACDVLLGAVGHGRTAALQMLLARAPPQRALDEALLMAAGDAGGGDRGIVELLLQHGADIEARDGLRRTPLMLADLNAATVKLLLAHGAKVNARDADGQTALFRAYNVDVARALVAAGADPKAWDDEGKTVLFSALTGEMAGYYVSLGLDVNARDALGRTPLMAASFLDVDQVLVKAGADVNARDNSGWTPLFGVIDAKAMQFLLDSGADPRIKDKKGETALDLVVRDKDPFQTAEIIRAWLKSHPAGP